MIRFPPPLCLRNVILLRGNGHRPDESHFLRPPKLVLEGVLYGTFCPPQNRTIRFAPPLCEFPELPPGTKPIHAGKNSWRINFCANTCGACSRVSANTGKYFKGIIFEICIRTLAPALCIDIVPVFAHPWCQYIKIFWGINFGANTCGTCIHTRANTGKYSWRIIHVLVSCQGVIRSQEGLTKPQNRTNNTNKFSEQFEGATGWLPSKTRVLRQIAPDSSPEQGFWGKSHQKVHPNGD